MIILKIIDYSSKYNEDIKDLLVELQEYITKMDREKYNILTDEYREKYFEKTLDEVNRCKGKMFLAIEDENVIGLIVGVINNENAQKFYYKNGYFNRNIEIMKKIWRLV